MGQGIERPHHVPEVESFDESHESTTPDISKTKTNYDFNAVMSRTSDIVKKGYSKSRLFYRERKSEIKHYATVTASVLFVVVLFQNIASSQFSFLFWEISAPKVVLFFIMLAVGGGVGYWLRGREIRKKHGDTGQTTLH